MKANINMIKRTGYLLLASLLLFVLIGCGSTKAYSGHTRPSSEIATLKAWGVTLHSVNGIEIGSMSRQVLLAPGKNEIKLSINASNFNSRGIDDKVYTLVMDAKPGRAYAITGKRGSGNVCAFEIDQETGEPNYSLAAGCLTN